MVVIEDDYEYKPFAGFQCYKVDPISLFSSYMLYEAVSLLPSDKLVEKIVKHDSWPIQPHIFSPPLLWLTFRKPLWLDLQTADIKSQWRHNWKSAQVVNCHLVCDPTIQQPGFRPPSATVVSAEPFLHGTGTLQCLQKEMATYRHWSVSLWQDPDDVPHYRILSLDKTEWRLVSATLCGWRCCFMAD